MQNSSEMNLISGKIDYSIGFSQAYMGESSIKIVKEFCSSHAFTCVNAATALYEGEKRMKNKNVIVSNNMIILLLIIR